MKQSTGRLFNARLLSRNTAVGIAAAAAVALVVAACGGNSHTACPNLPMATAVIGQASYTVGTPNTGGVTASSLGGVQGSVAASGDTLYVADTSNNRVLGYKPIPSGIGPAASFVIGQASATQSDAGTAPAGGSAIKFNNPSRVWVDPTNTYLAVADSSNNRVLIWNSLPTSSAVAPNVVIGQPDFTTGDANHPSATISASGLSNPTAAIIANGRLIVVDKGNNRVLIWNTVPTTNNAPANLVLGQAGFTTNSPNIDQYNNATATYALAMRQPSDAWTNGARLIISDTGNHRVLFWNNIPNVANQIADNVIGQSQFGFTSISGGSGTQGLHSPWGVSSDGTSVFVADVANNRIVEFTNYLTIPQNGPAANYVFGQEDFTHITANDPDQNNQVGDQRNNPATLGPTQGTLFNPQGVFATVGGQLLVTDSGNSRVTIYTTASGVDGSHIDLCN